ncbi:MAG: hypothetical protein JXA72_00645 [Bacteroidales bacterium]|nr:hypothetical protein [Bacteroidales bacterium]
MKATILRDSYFLVNLSFLIIILAVFGYSLFFGAAGREYPLPSGSAILTGEPSVSTGLSRSFSALMRFDMEQARLYNRHGFRIFLFFMIQLAMRTGAMILCLHAEGNIKKRIVGLDILLSVGLFIILFWPFLSVFAMTIASHS